MIDTITEKEGRVVLIEDDANALSVMEKALRKFGFEVTVYQTADDAWEELCSSDSWGCIVTDLRLPGLTGADLQRRLVEKDSSLSVVVISGYADVPAAIDVMSKGAVTLLQKPFRLEELVDAVQRGLELSKTRYWQKQKRQAAISKISRLTDEELEVMQCAAKGMPNKAISQALDLSPRTIDRRRKAAYSKLEISSAAEFAFLQASSQTPSEPFRSGVSP